MPITEKKWSLLTPDQNQFNALRESLNIHPVLCRLLVQRGITNYEDARKFFRPSLHDLHDPFLMKDMNHAVNRIIAAMAGGEKILIYGDYDVDGTTAVALVYRFLLKFYDRIDYYIPHRYREGYGISTESIDFAEANNFTLIIALDCGIKSIDKVNYATAKKIDFIICDHHLPGNEIPAAVAVLDPKRNDCHYPYKELSGCGIGFKLMQAFCLQQGIPQEDLFTMLDLVCTSIACDIVPITGENRILAHYGLKQLNTAPSAGLRSLLEVAVVNRSLSITDVVFILGPRINAAGRMDDGRHAVKLLIGEAAPAANQEAAETLQSLNRERKDLDKSITEEAIEMILAESSLQNKKSTVLHHPAWHKGVVGIVASRLIEHYHRPTIILTGQGEVISGSARSVNGFDLYEAIYECRDLLIQFGGHRAAAGLTLRAELLPAFTERFEAVVSSKITPEQLIPEIPIDAEIAPGDIDYRFYNILQQMAPFGPGNMKPVFMLKNMQNNGWSRVVKEQHLKLSLRNPGAESLAGIGFGLGHKMALLEHGPIDVCFHIEENHFNNKTSLQLQVKDIREATI
ncbi:MAG: single-stranded-DNA-specific exonuclease RecJ [Chitinophagales bacterium]